MVKRIVSSVNNPTPAQIQKAYDGWVPSWADASKIRFALIGNESLEMSVMVYTEEGAGLRIRGFRESGNGVDVYFNPINGLGSFTELPVAPQPESVQA